MATLALTTQDTICNLAAEMMAAASDADRARIDRAIDLVSQVERTVSPSVYLVHSASKQDRAYQVQNNLCNCADTPRERGATCCKHSWAVQLFNRLERADAEAHDPTILIHVDSEDEAIPYTLGLRGRLGGEPCDLPPQCSRCHAEPASPRHRDGLGARCIAAELWGPDDVA